MRRTPVQVRSLAKVARMLDACAEIVDEVGYEGLTTTLIAERAEVAIGSVYQFFPDKRAVVAALTQRNLEAYVRRLADRMESGGMSRWVEAVDAALDEYIDMHRNVPGFRTLHFGDVVDLNLLDPERDNNAVIVDNLGRLLEQHFGMARTEELAFALTMAVEMADALVKAAFRYQVNGDERILNEAKKIIRDYLDRRIPDGGQAGASRPVEQAEKRSPESISGQAGGDDPAAPKDSGSVGEDGGSSHAGG